MPRWMWLIVAAILILVLLILLAEHVSFHVH